MTTALEAGTRPGILDSDWVDSLIGPSGKVSSLSDFIEVEDVLLEDNEKLISDCRFF
jgi:hypothetical protein